MTLAPPISSSYVSALHTAGKGRPVFAIENLAVSVPSPDGRVALVHDVSLSVGRGECHAVVGESGCGKTVTCLAALGLMPRNASVSGSVRLGDTQLLNGKPGELEAMRGRRIGMIFQDPQGALNPVRTIGRQLIEPLRLHLGMSREAARDRACELLALVGISAPETRLDAYPHQLSGGTCQRVMIAMALATEPDVLIADEPTTALDATVQLQVLDLLKSIQRQRDLAIVLITHDLGVVSEICDSVTVLYAGRSVESRAKADLFASPRHPYTRALLDCLPSLDPEAPPPAAISGEVPSPGQHPSGCAFHPRCRGASPACARSLPTPMPAGPDGMVRCHHPAGAAGYTLQ
ncbi:ABC transporter ATP-binding protein [Pelagibacterium sp. H642]|uniref:ABC transporter ATP-binding protein n=1 Tax=Pelagibacterium sp. H642 TaxID=1881069 RepID=UPI002815A54D|nr:ABC transporter ATP-binding protein [Pelagibacterium sp. H642]WMT92732.1 ABC transporter ATP-binding protein [Pelagibacterium sp. H642]